MSEPIQEVPIPPPWEEQNPVHPYPGYYPNHPNEWLYIRHATGKQTAKERGGQIRVVFLGDSITQNWSQEVWARHFEPLSAVNFGIGGDKTCQVLWRIADGLLDGLSPELVVLAIGVNSIWSGAFSTQQIAAGIYRCVEAIQTACPASKILISAVLPCKESPDHPYRATVQAINAATALLDNGRSIRFIDAGPILLESDHSLSVAIAPDGVHLSKPGYERLATVVVPAIQEMLAES